MRKYTVPRTMVMEFREAVEVPVVVKSPQDVADWLSPRTAGLLVEQVRVLSLNTKLRLIRDDLVTSGIVNASQGHPREIFRMAIQANACSIILAHNHPSGDTTPSAEDIRFTKQVAEAGKIIGIELTDHVIVGVAADGSPCRTSLREAGLL